MFKKFLCAVAAVVAVAGSALGAEWMNDMEAAKSKAAAEGKAVLVFFTGSNWCHFCARLREGILDTEAFQAYAADKFVLMEVDVPRGKSGFPADLLQRNKRLCEDFKVRGFPTLLVLTPEGRVVGGMRGFRPYLEMVQQPLDEALVNIQTLRKAESASGEERVKLLRAAYDAIPEEFRGCSTLQEEVMKADAEVAAQVAEARAVAEQMQEIQIRLRMAGSDEKLYLDQLEYEIEHALPANKPALLDLQQRMETVAVYRELNRLQEDPAACLAYLDEKLEKAQGSLRTMILGLKAPIQLETAKTVEDVMAAKATMEEVLKATPDDAVLRRHVEKMFADPEALLKQKGHGGE